MNILLRPEIGITLSQDSGKSYRLKSAYVNAIASLGGFPILLPYLNDTTAELAQKLDGLVISGGIDPDPALYGEEPIPQLGEVCPSRDIFELGIIKEFLNLDKPILGICRGCQMLNIAMGGTLYQDINVQLVNVLQHRQKAPRSHPTQTIVIDENTILHNLTYQDTAKVNSFHHQAVKDVGKDLIVTARALDGIVEAIESTKHKFVLGVQWHPEEMVKEDIFTQKIFEAFVSKCKSNLE